MTTWAESAAYEISPSGYGIHWPLIDEDLSIDGLLGVKHRPGSPSAKNGRVNTAALEMQGMARMTHQQEAGREMEEISSLTGFSFRSFS